MKLKSKDLLKLEREFFKNLTFESGGICLDGKRPFGNSDIESDILDIIGAEPGGEDEDHYWSSKQRDYAWELYCELVPYLKKKYGK